VIAEEDVQANSTRAFDTDQKGHFLVHADAKGLAHLIGSLERLKTTVEAGECDHDHMHTDAWAGDELSERTGCEKGANSSIT
jgi:hypothetical protein